MIFYWLREKISKFLVQRLEDKEGIRKAERTERGEYHDNRSYSNGKFNDDYTLSCTILKQSLDESHPDNYHARLRPGYDPKYDYSTARSEAIDTSSAAIALSLRAGSGIEAAIAAGQRSIAR
ncbi:hypothetical protein [Methylorubrum suomiense]|uniref:hypothetical protein n=1 Tax=Methylorubrum suomiense TaxID=144191 RepID=UPI001EE369F5|nr:hypothetical protein [Methylorubrum suomiense]